MLKQKNKVDYYIYRLLDFLVLIGLTTVAFVHLPERYIPKILHPFFFYDQYASVYFFSLFAIIFFFFVLIKDREYKKVLFLICAGAFFSIIQMVVVVHGLLLLKNITISDTATLEGTRLYLFNLVFNKFHLPQNNALYCSEIVYTLISSLIEYKDTFFIVFCLYFYYRQRINTLKSIIDIGVYLSFGLLCLYEVIEISYLLNFDWARNLLIKINPLFLEINSAHGWWPPLLWSGQLRGFFPEPSFLGYYLGFVLCFFLYKFTCKPNFINAFIAFISIVLSVLTDSRMAIALMFGVVMMYLIFNFFIRKNIKYVYIIISFALALYAPTVVKMINTKSFANDVSITRRNDHLKSLETFASIADPTARSNISRYSHLKAQICIWKEHPILGVGPDYVGPHMSVVMKQSENISAEMKNWFNYQEKLGQLTSTYPSLCQYSYWLSVGGIVLFALYMLVICYVCIRYLVVVVCKKGISIITDFSFFIISCMAVVLVFGIGDSLMRNYFYLFFLGVALIDCKSLCTDSDSKRITVQNNNL